MGNDTNVLAQYLPRCAKQSTLRKPKHTERGFRAETCLFPLAMNVKQNVTSIVNSVEITCHSSIFCISNSTYSLFFCLYKNSQTKREGSRGTVSAFSNNFPRCRLSTQGQKLTLSAGFVCVSRVMLGLVSVTKRKCLLSLSLSSSLPFPSCTELIY